MDKFYIDVEISRGATRIQVDEVLPEHWDMPCIPQFVIEFYSGRAFLNLTVQLVNGSWYDRNTLLSEEDFRLSRFEPWPEQAWNADYQSPLNAADLKAIGMAISNYMIIRLTAYMGLFVPQYRNPTLN